MANTEPFSSSYSWAQLVVGKKGRTTLETLWQLKDLMLAKVAMLPSRPRLEPELMHNPELLLSPQLALPQVLGMSRNWPSHRS